MPYSRGERKGSRWFAVASWHTNRAVNSKLHARCSTPKRAMTRNQELPAKPWAKRSLQSQRSSVFARSGGSSTMLHARCSTPKRAMTRNQELPAKPWAKRSLQSQRSSVFARSGGSSTMLHARCSTPKRAMTRNQELPAKPWAKRSLQSQRSSVFARSGGSSTRLPAVSALYSLISSRSIRRIEHLPTKSNRPHPHRVPYKSRHSPPGRTALVRWMGLVPGHAADYYGQCGQCVRYRR